MRVIILNSMPTHIRVKTVMNISIPRCVPDLVPSSDPVSFFPCMNKSLLKLKKRKRLGISGLKFHFLELYFSQIKWGQY